MTLNLAIRVIPTWCKASCLTASILISTGCTTLYISPAISGVVLSQTTNQPIQAKHIIYSKGQYADTDKDGKFYLQPATMKYFMLYPDIRALNAFARDTRILVMLDGFEINRFDYSPYEIANRKFDQIYKIDVGKIYLTPKSNESNPTESK